MTRICESNWHEPIELKPFEQCPRCGSMALHLEDNDFKDVVVPKYE